jgi:xylan 1,4-beta-xylosidase
LATRDERSVSVLVWNYHDDDLPAEASAVDLTISGIPSFRVTVTQAQVDRNHANSYEKWRALGSPQEPTPAQYAELEKASALVNLATPVQAEVRGSKLVVPFMLPRQGVLLVRVAR